MCMASAWAILSLVLHCSPDLSHLSGSTTNPTPPSTASVLPSYWSVCYVFQITAFFQQSYSFTVSLTILSMLLDRGISCLRCCLSSVAWTQRCCSYVSLIEEESNMRTPSLTFSLSLSLSSSFSFPLCHPWFLGSLIADVCVPSVKNVSQEEVTIGCRFLSQQSRPPPSYRSINNYSWVLKGQPFIEELGQLGRSE